MSIPMETIMNNNDLSTTSFAYPYGARNTTTDNLLLNRFERIGLLVELLDWNPSDLHRINLITAN